MCTISRATDIKMIVNLPPCVVKDLWSYSFNCGYDSTRWLISVMFSPYTMFPQKKKSRGVRSGLYTGHGIGPSRPIHDLGNPFKASRTDREK
ncbi:hypothetical protein AVEN_142711-1 [Araneus ventricosus]|uniref:Uncharacterized protein n=1 Tax=Araneus ventricosus TaxID=182803 RepID=A0A4Y2K208_ARAVE|nr:hypothetical protein AVEN_142711-1 [Araneus ventricosus]